MKPSAVDTVWRPTSYEDIEIIVPTETERQTLILLLLTEVTTDRKSVV